jgi:uncharacterized protein YebE (UPF0316 family)
VLDGEFAELRLGALEALRYAAARWSMLAVVVVVVVVLLLLESALRWVNLVDVGQTSGAAAIGV